MYYQLLFLDTKAPLCLPVSYYYTCFDQFNTNMKLLNTQAHWYDWYNCTSVRRCMNS